MTVQETLAAHIAQARLHQERWEATVNDFPLFYEDLAKLGIEVRFSEFDGSLDIRFTGDGELFRRVWKLVRSIGFEPNSRPLAGAQAEFCTFWHHSDPRYSRIWLQFSSSICRAVKVGTKLVEEPIYEISCGDGQTPLGMLLSSENDNPLARE